MPPRRFSQPEIVRTLIWIFDAVFQALPHEVKYSQYQAIARPLEKKLKDAKEKDWMTPGSDSLSQEELQAQVDLINKLFDDLQKLCQQINHTEHPEGRNRLDAALRLSQGFNAADGRPLIRDLPSDRNQVS